jgi:hypothetical protein
MAYDIAQRLAPRAARLLDTTQHDPRGPDRAHSASSCAGLSGVLTSDLPQKCGVKHDQQDKPYYQSIISFHLNWWS